VIRRMRVQPAVRDGGVSRPKAMEAIITSRPRTGRFLMPPGRTAKIRHTPASPPSAVWRLVTAAIGPAVGWARYAIELDESAPAPLLRPWFAIEAAARL